MNTTENSHIEEPYEIFPYYIIKFFEAYEGTWQQSTFITYTAEIKEFLSWLCREGFSPASNIKDIDIDVLNNLFLEDVIDYKNYLKSQKNKNGLPLANTTVNKKLSSVKSLFKFLIKNSDRNTRKPYLDRNVMDQLPLLNDENTEDTRIEHIQENILVDEEINEFREFVRVGFEAKVTDNTRILNRWKKNRERDSAIISLLLGTGLRIAELESLTIKDIDIQSRKLYVVRKGGEKRTVPYSKRAHKDLMTYLDIRQARYKATKDENALFLTLYGDSAKPMTKRAMQKMIEKYAEMFGKPQVTAHKLRHSFATNHIKKVNSIPLLQKILNHKSPTTTMIYSKVFDSEIQDSIDQADN